MILVDIIIYCVFCDLGLCFKVVGSHLSYHCVFWGCCNKCAQPVSMQNTCLNRFVSKVQAFFIRYSYCLKSTQLWLQRIIRLAQCTFWDLQLSGDTCVFSSTGEHVWRESGFWSFCLISSHSNESNVNHDKFWDQIHSAPTYTSNFPCDRGQNCMMSLFCWCGSGCSSSSSCGCGKW